MREHTPNLCSLLTLKMFTMKFRIVKGIAGSFILISLILTQFVHPNWIWMTVFVGVNLLQSSITKWCLLEVILDKLGVKNSSEEGCCS